jgi:DNA-binding CsgD family transcriptional regulator
VLPRPPPLVGRTDVLRSLVRLLTDGGSVVLSGPQGIGKTRLAHELCRCASEGGAWVDRVIATAETSTDPFGTLYGLGVVTEEDPPLRSFAELIGRWADLEGEGRPPVLWVDDTHHADPMTAAVVRHAVAAGGLRLVATCREHADLPADLDRLVGESVAERWAVGPLSSPDTRRLARASVTPAVLGRGHEEAIVDLARGNPLYVRELARSAARGEDLGSGGRLDRLLGRAVDGLAPEARHVLDLVAAAEPVPPSLLDGSREHLRHLRALGLLGASGDAGVRIDHPLRRAWLLRELGPRRPQVLRELLDAVSAAPGAGPDAVTLVEWHDGAGREPPEGLHERAARVALTRGRSDVARRLADRLGGEAADLLRAEAMAVDGDLDRALPALDDLALSSTTRCGLEALWWAVRHHGLTRGDVARAEALLRAVEARRTGREVEQVVLRSRLWLWAHRRPPDDADLEAVERAVARLPPGVERLEMTSALFGVVVNDRGCSGVDALVHRLDEDDARLEGWSTTRLRSRMSLGWSWLLRLDADRAVAAFRTGHRAAVSHHDLEGVLALGGSGGLALAACGLVREASRLSAPWAAEPEDPRAWFRMADLRAAVHAGNLCYLGRADEAARLLEQLTSGDARSAPEPMPVLLARARRLVAEAGGPVDVEQLAAELELGRARRKHLALGVVVLESLDLTAPEPALTAALTATEGIGGGLCGIASAVSRARVEHDVDTLREAAELLESGGVVTAALRVASDVVRLSGPGEGPHVSARAGILRLLERWEGSEPRWVEDLPTPRQREVAVLVAHGRTPSEVADELVLSRRTVENHLQRVYEYLGVHSRTELVGALRPRRGT